MYIIPIVFLCLFTVYIIIIQQMFPSFVLCKLKDVGRGQGTKRYMINKNPFLLYLFKLSMRFQKVFCTTVVTRERISFHDFYHHCL